MARGRALAALAAVLALALLAPPAAAQWVVETNSLRIKTPASAAGEYDAAIGDVRGWAEGLGGGCVGAARPSRRPRAARLPGFGHGLP